MPETKRDIHALMIPVYVTLIKAGRRTPESVPEKIRAAVAAQLEEAAQTGAQE